MYSLFYLPPSIPCPIVNRFQRCVERGILICEYSKKLKASLNLHTVYHYTTLNKINIKKIYILFFFISPKFKRTSFLLNITQKRRRLFKNNYNIEKINAKKSTKVTGLSNKPQCQLDFELLNNLQ